MNIEEIREYCLSLPHTTEDMAFGEDYLLLRLEGKIFACIALDSTGYLTLKCNPEYATELRDHYPEIIPAWHWNKKYWNQLNLNGQLSDRFITSLIRHSYSEVAQKLSKTFRTANPEIFEIKE